MANDFCKQLYNQDGASILLDKTELINFVDDLIVGPQTHHNRVWFSKES